jgi:hypothetical protein
MRAESYKLGVPHFSRVLRVGRHTADTIMFLVLGSGRSNLHLQHITVVDLNWTGFPKSVSSKAAPMPKFRGGRQSARHWIAMHVAQFFDAFACRPHVEVVEAFLPDVLWGVLKQCALRVVQDGIVKAGASTDITF